jgi:hypothetical protein
MLIINEPRLEHLAALALLAIDGPDYYFSDVGSTRQEIELRLDHDMGAVSFYDRLGLPIPISEIKETEIRKMFNRLFLQVQFDNRPYYLNN